MGLLILKSTRSLISREWVIPSTNQFRRRRQFSRENSSMGLTAATCCSASLCQATKHEVKHRRATRMLCVYFQWIACPAAWRSANAQVCPETAGNGARGFGILGIPLQPRAEHQEQAGGRRRLRVPGVWRWAPGLPLQATVLHLETCSRRAWGWI